MAYSYEHDPTNADATPMYNDSIFKFWNWFDAVWNCFDWVTWHKAMAKKYGRDYANVTFLHHWDNLAMGSSAIDCRSTNTAFRDYTKSVGLYDYLYTGLETIVQPIGVGTDVVTNLGKGISNTTKIGKFILPLLLIVVAVFAIVYLSKMTKSK